MARLTSYFHPVRDLLSEEEKNLLVDNWKKYKLSEKWDNTKLLEIIENQDNNIKFKNAVKESWTYHFEVHNSITNKDFNKAYPKDFLNDLCERYYADDVRFLYAKDDTIKTKPHIDPKGFRTCCVNVPLFPAYNEYRNTNFHESVDDSPVFVVDYSKIKSPVLLNNMRIHSTGGWHSPTESLGVQFSYYKPYEEVRSMLQSKGILWHERLTTITL